MNKILKYAICLALPLALPVGSNAMASTATTTFPVTAMVIDSCEVAATPLAFGSYNSISATSADAVGTITATCTTGTSFTVTLNQGTGSGALVVARKMTGPAGATLDYAIYADALRSSIWGDGSAGTTYHLATGDGMPKAIGMYGLIPASQRVATGSYADTITVTLSY